MKRFLANRTAVVALATLPVIACSDSSGPDTTPASVAAVFSPTLNGTVGQPLPVPITAVVANAGGGRLEGVTVTWAVTGGGGSLAATSSVTDSEGSARVAWTLGTTAGANTATATVAPLPPASFAALANAGPATHIIPLSGSGQVGEAGRSLPQPMIVLARDQYLNPVAQATVDWEVTLGGGQLSSTSGPTGLDGRMSVTWTLGTLAGVNRATAALRGVQTPVATFQVSGVGGPATQLFIVSGNNQQGWANQDLPHPLVVVTRDQHNNPAPGVTVDWSVATGNGQLSATSVTTGTDGHASVTWRMGSAAGTDNYSATVSVNGVPASAVTFTASAASGVVTAVDRVSGHGQTGQAGLALAQPLTIRLRDQNGVPVAAHPVQWRLVTGGSIVAGSAKSDSDGLASATWTLDPIAGGNSVFGGTFGGSSIEFSALGVAGPPARLTAVSGAAQNGPAGTLLPAPLRVKVGDAFDNHIRDVPVEWSIVSGGGALSVTSAVTANDGTTTTRWTLGPSHGGQTVSLRVTQAPTVTIDFAAIAHSGGTISGTVTATNGPLAASAAVVSLARSPAPIAAATTRTRATKLRRVGSLQVAASGARIVATRGGDDVVAGELIVTYRSGSVPGLEPAALRRSGLATVNAVAGAMRSRLAAAERSGRLRVLGASPLVRAVRVRVTNPSMVDSIAESLRREPGISSVEPNRVASRVHAPATSVTPAGASNDPLYPFQAWHYAMIDLPDGWAITRGSASVLVAVVDDGIRFDHPDIATNLTSDGYDFVAATQGTMCDSGGIVELAGDGDGVDPDPTVPRGYIFDAVRNCIVEPEESGGHGLHVAGTIGAATDNALGVAGINPTVRIRPVRVLNTLGRGSTYDLAQGILYAAGLPADNGAGGTVQPTSAAHIINMSLSGPDSELKRNAVAAATAAGSLIIAAAGNAGVSTPTFPAGYDDVISVSALGPDGLLAGYSNLGSTIDIAAPGGDFSDGDCDFGVASTWWDFANSRPSYACLQGTSMATPHVSGVAALILAHSPGLTSAQLRARLLDFAVDIGAPGRDDFYGAGVLNARNSLTQTLSRPPGQVYATLYSATTGALVGPILTQAGGTFSFSGLINDNYYVFAGEDAGGDGRVGVPGRRWGAFGGSGRPAAVTVNGENVYPATFAAGIPTEVEPNNDPSAANWLPVGGYLSGMRVNSEEDYMKVVISQAGAYTFETSAVSGVCGFAVEDDSSLLLTGPPVGGIIGQNNDIDTAGGNFCARITVTLSPGVYTLRVYGSGSGRYRVALRPGS